jgi:hypothetical protein
MLENIDFKKVFLVTLIASLSISALCAIIIFLLGDFGELQLKILVTTLTIGVFSLTGLCCATLLNKQRFPLLAIFGIIASMWGILSINLLIWKIVNWDTSDSYWNSVIITIILSFSIAHSCLLLLINSKSSIVKTSLVITLLSISIVAIGLIILTLIEFANINNIWYRILGVFAVLDVLGTIVTPILLKITPPTNEKSV